MNGANAAQERSTVKSLLYVDPALSRYGFPGDHPLGVDRQGAFLKEAVAQDLLTRAAVQAPRRATREEIERFHTGRHVTRVINAEQDGLEFLDNGDTPVFPGVYEAAATVVGAALDGLARIMRGEAVRSLQPIGGLHHAGRNHAAGFCVFNDLGVVIETLRLHYGIRRVAYVDIDVHHGAGDDAFIKAWSRVEAHLARFEPEFVVFQCGADGLAGDPLAHLQYSPAAHRHAARSLVRLAGRFAGGRLMAFGGGGYNRDNLAKAWSAVLQEIS